ncbi:MAG: WG repeat-containing protein [Clostridium sp.]
MIKKIISVGIIGMLVFAMGCSSPKIDEKKNLWQELADEEISNRKEAPVQGLERVNLYPFYDEYTGYYGYMNDKAETVVEATLTAAGDFYYGVDWTTAYDANGEVVYIDKDGEVIPANSNLGAFEYPIDGLVRFSDNGLLYGVKDSEGNVIIEPTYEYIRIYTGGCIGFGENNKYGVMDKLGNEIIPAQYDEIYELYDVFIVTEGARYGVYHKEGNQVFPVEYIDYSPINKDRIALQDNTEKYAIYDFKGKAITGHDYDKIVSRNSSNMVQASKEDKWGYMTPDGKVIIDFQYEYISLTEDPHYALITQDKKQGLLSSTGELLIEPKYTEISLTFDEEKNLKKDIYMVSFHGENQIIDGAGEVVTDNLPSGFLYYMDDKILTYDKDNNYLILDTKGNEIVTISNFVYEQKYGIDNDGFLGIPGGYIVDCDTGERVNDEYYDSVTGYPEFNRLVAVKGEDFIIMDGEFNMLSEHRIQQTGYREPMVTVYGEELIKVQENDVRIKWYNSAGEIIK